MSEAIELEERFTITSDLQAQWHMERRAKILADRDKLIEFYKERIQAAEEDAENRVAKIDHDLLMYFDTVPHKVTKTQESYTLPGGKMYIKQQNPEFKRDDKTVIEWLKQNNGTGYIKTKEELDWAQLKADTAVVDDSVVNFDGEAIPGITVVHREPKFIVEVKDNG